MERKGIEVVLPGGQRKHFRPAVKAPAGESLAWALEEQGFPLNTRCGGRGLCRGCQVRVEDEAGPRTIRACQVPLSGIGSRTSRIVIPENSWRDHSLHGVSLFEIHTQVEFPPSGRSGYGVALDVGTTTLAAALWDYEGMVCLGHESRPNPQARFGDNVLSRIDYSNGNTSGRADLQRVLVKEGLQPMIRALCEKSGVLPAALHTATVSGNPTMLHTLAGESVAGLSRYPFTPVFLAERSIDSLAAGFDFPFNLTLLPSLGPFVGADILAGALAAGMLEEEGPVLLIDFGTNGEILLKCGGQYLATATAAGPAFEGGRLSCGAAARKGVISSIRREGDAWRWNLCPGSDESRPVGISGAAYVDFLAHGAEAGLLDHFGRFDRTNPEVQSRDQDGELEWTIPIGDETYVTEGDVAELLQAKAAIGGGVTTLLELAGIEAADLKKVLVAGGFGYHLNPSSGIRIGLLPDVPVQRIHTIGNSSLGGACLLLNEHAHPLVQPLVGSCEVVELNQIASFEDHFTDCLMLEPCGDPS